MPKGQPKKGTRSWGAHSYATRIQVGKNADGTPKYKYKYTTKAGFKKTGLSKGRTKAGW